MRLLLLLFFVTSSLHAQTNITIDDLVARNTFAQRSVYGIN